MTNFDRQELIGIYLSDAEECLTRIEQSLIALEETPENASELIDEIFRGAHTLKGNSATLGFDDLTRFAHGMEDLLERMRSGRVTPEAETVTLLLRCCDVFRELIPGAVAGRTQPDSAAETLLESLAQVIECATSSNATPLATRDNQATGNAEGAPSVRKMRIDLERLDRIVDLASELSIARGRLSDSMVRLCGHDREILLPPYEELTRLLGNLQEQVTKVRMVPIGPLFEGQRRVLRGLSHAAGKPARLAVEGGAVQIDASLVQQLNDPLTHMIRNAVDHGIELPEARRRSGKNPIARVTLAAWQEGANVVIEVRDDGAGFDRDRILARARERGMVASNALPSDQEIDALAFTPGFSTAAEVTEISGRGVGMDVVAKAIAAMRGSVRVASRRGEGTTIAIRLPLTLAMLPGLGVEAERERFVIPLHSITRCAAVPASEPRRHAFGLVEVDGTMLPYVRLRRAFALESELDPPLEQLVVVQSASALAGIICDGVIGEMQAVIKPLGPLFRNLDVVSASTIFPDGRVGLILDVAALVKHAIGERAA